VEAVQEKNEALIEENQALKDQLKNAELIELENERLRAYLGM
jgi:cell shape-determining protein MreC